MRISDWSSDVCSSDLFVLPKNVFSLAYSVRLESTSICPRRTSRPAQKWNRNWFFGMPACSRIFVDLQGRCQAHCSHQYQSASKTRLLATAGFRPFPRSEERRVGKECVSTSKVRGWLDNEKKKPNRYEINI